MSEWHGLKRVYRARTQRASRCHRPARALDRLLSVAQENHRHRRHQRPPLLPKQQTIIQQDAVLAYDAKTPRKRKVEVASSWLHSDRGNKVEVASSCLNPDKKVEVASSCLNPDKKTQQDTPPTIEEFVCIWDGRSTKTHPVTGKEVPDESVTIPVYDYSNPRRAEWPEADYIVGNPPFIGKGERMREFLGDGYVESLRKIQF